LRCISSEYSVCWIVSRTWSVRLNTSIGDHGGTSIVAILELADATDLDCYLTERVGTLPGVMHVETDIAVRWIKRASPLIRRR
jgi:hypothetical protein